MPSLNKVILIGNLTADPELKQTQTGISVCSFRIGVQRKYKNQDGTYTSDFINIQAWRQTAEFVCKYFRKGSAIIVCGSIQTRDYTAQDGTKRYVTEISADEVGFAESAKNAEVAAPANTAPSGGKGRYGTYKAPAVEKDAPPPPASGYNAPPPPADNFVELNGDDELPF